MTPETFKLIEIVIGSALLIGLLAVIVNLVLLFWLLKEGEK